jgi:hypothetical protein
VRAAEDQALRQVHERQRVAVASSGSSAKALRDARREVAVTEAVVTELESKVAGVVAALEDPALYTRPDGATTARQLGAELETLKRDLDLALERWTRATERVEKLAGAATQ